MAYIWLSHELTPDLPQYGGADDFKIVQEKSIGRGDSCNTSTLLLPSHAGTHVDAPLHFIKDGKGIDDYPPEDWVFNRIQLLNTPAEPGQIIREKDLVLDENSDTELILIQTFFDRYRHKAVFWESNPGLSPALADFLIAKCPNLKMVGMDFISISSYVNRDLGRKAHTSFLNKGIRLIEDMKLGSLQEHGQLEQIIVSPVRFSGSDGAPCTIIGVTS